uniref:Uncharacterized protein n=1 Tax=Amphimedon queenslandica TaxID=400682 RepID=A0A1X7TMR9_AMPQE
MASEPSPLTPCGSGIAPPPQPSPQLTEALAHRLLLSLSTFVLRDLPSTSSDSVPCPPKGVRDLWADILFFTLRSVVDCPDDLDAWSCLLNGILLLPSKFRKAIALHLCGASLLPSHRKSGGLCPIAIGEVHSIFHPHQVGVGCPNEAESIIHLVKLLVVMEKASLVVSLSVHLGSLLLRQAGVHSSGISMGQSTSPCSLFAWREVPSLVPGSLSRPANIFIESWSVGQPAAMHVTVISLLQQRILDRSATDRGYALLFTEE